MTRLNLTSTKLHEAGIFTWHLTCDRVYADTAVAELYGFSAKQAWAGLPLHDMMRRIHPEDLPRISATIKETVAATGAYDEIFRLLLPDGTIRHVASTGRCFRDESGPAYYAGIIYPVPEEIEPEALIVGYFDAAEVLAITNCRPEVACRIQQLKFEVARLLMQ